MAAADQPGAQGYRPFSPAHNGDALDSHRRQRTTSAHGSNGAANVRRHKPSGSPLLRGRLALLSSVGVGALVGWAMGRRGGGGAGAGSLGGVGSAREGIEGAEGRGRGSVFVQE